MSLNDSNPITISMIAMDRLIYLIKFLTIINAIVVINDKESNVKDVAIRN